MATQQDLEASNPVPVLKPARNRRAYPRHAVDCPVRVSLLPGAGESSGRISNLSLGGCVIACETRLRIGIKARVEIAFQLQGLLFRMAGVAVSIFSANSFAIRFLDVSARRHRELGATIAEEVSGVGERKAPSRPVELPRSTPVSPSYSASSAPVILTPRTNERLVETDAGTVQSTSLPRHGKERRTDSRHAVDSRANLLLVNTGITMAGRIHDLSLGGCQIRLEEQFNVGIYIRIEAEFFLHNLPFRVGGVSQSILDKHTVGIRFLDLSSRLQAQLGELMAEIAEAEAQRLHSADADLPPLSK